MVKIKPMGIGHARGAQGIHSHMQILIHIKYFLKINSVRITEHNPSSPITPALKRSLKID